MKQEYKEAFTEVNEIINLMPIELVNKIPIKFQEMIKEEMDTTYKPTIKEPIENCKLREETVILLGLIYRDFLCPIEERKILQEKDAKEFEKLKKEIENEIKEKYNLDNIFKQRRQNITKQQIVEENTSLTVINEEKWYKKIFNIIKKLFKKDR